MAPKKPTPPPTVDEFTALSQSAPVEVPEQSPPPALPPSPPPPQAVFLEDAGMRLYQDRAGKAIVHGLTEGSDNFATMTQAARSVLPPSE